METTSNNKINQNWGFRKGPGLLVYLTAGMFVITILVWRSVASWRGAAAGIFILSLIVLIFFGQLVSCRFDVDRRIIHLRWRKIWKTSERVVPFDKVENVAVTSSGTGTTSRVYSVSLVLTSGERLRLSAHPSSGKLAKEKLAQRIADTLNQYQQMQISPILNGVVEVVREGETCGLPWRVKLITANDMVPVTQWFSSGAKFEGGFVLLIPAVGSPASGTGKLPKTIRFFYQQYLRTLMIDEAQIPGFPDAIQLKKEDFALGDQYTCISNEPAAASEWFTESFAHKLNRWTSYPEGKSKEHLHLLVTAEGVRLIFRKLYYQDDVIQKIADFGAALIEEKIT